MNSTTKDTEPSPPSERFCGVGRWVGTNVKQMGRPSYPVGSHRHEFARQAQSPHHGSISAGQGDGRAPGCSKPCERVSTRNSTPGRELQSASPSDDLLTLQLRENASGFFTVEKNLCADILLGQQVVRSRLMQGTHHPAWDAYTDPFAEFPNPWTAQLHDLIWEGVGLHPTDPPMALAKRPIPEDSTCFVCWCKEEPDYDAEFCRKDMEYFHVNVKDSPRPLPTTTTAAGEMPCSLIQAPCCTAFFHKPCMVKAIVRGHPKCCHGQKKLDTDVWVFVISLSELLKRMA